MSIDRIVTDARAKPLMLYRHFRSNDAVLRGVLERCQACFLALLEPATRT